MNKRSFLALLLIILVSIALVSCGGKSVAPGVSSETGTDETPRPQAASEKDEGEEYKEGSDQVGDVCEMNSILVVVDYDHHWVWSPDGTEDSGRYTGRANGLVKLYLSNNGDGTFSEDKDTIFYSQDGIIDGHPGDCTVEGTGMAEITMNGYCYDDVLNLDLMEVGTGETEGNMVCDGKDFNYLTYYPPQAVIGLEVSDQGLGYISSSTTLMPMFRDIHMKWNVRVVPEGELD